MFTDSADMSVSAPTHAAPGHALSKSSLPPSRPLAQIDCSCHLPAPPRAP